MDLRGRVLGARLPLWDPILSFLHTFSPKSTCIGGPRPPPLMGARPTLREILDPPLSGDSKPCFYKQDQIEHCRTLQLLFSSHQCLRSNSSLLHYYARCIDIFTSHMFAEFTKECNFDHNTNSPRNSRCNGQAEAAVKVVKDLLT